MKRKSADTIKTNIEESSTFGSNERGVAMVEMAILISLMAIGCLSAVRSLGQTTEVAFGDIEWAIASGGIVSLPPPPP